MKLSLGLIVRNAETTIEECLNSVLPYVDEVVIGLGGKSTDRTVEILERTLGAWGHDKPWEFFPIDWQDDFAQARNEVWARLTGDAALWLDADDILVGGDKLRAYVEQDPEPTAFTVPYLYEEDEYGNPACTLVRERVVRPIAAWHWVGRVHEILQLDPANGVPFNHRFLPDILVKHNPKRTRDKGTRNLDLLYKELERTEPDPPQRLLFYLGRENASRNNLKEALLHLNRYISRASVDVEAYQVALMIANILRAQGRNEDARIAAMRAIHIQPSWPDSYYMLARIAYEQGAFAECIEWTKAGETKDPPVTGVIVDPRDYTYWPFYYFGLACLQLGLFDEGLASLQRALAQTPNDERLLTTIRAVMDSKQSQDASRTFLSVWEMLARHDEWLKARELFRLAPKAIETHPDVRAAWEKTARVTAHVENPQLMVDFYRGNPGWTPYPDELILKDGEGTGIAARLAFARKALCGPPKYVLDMGSSDGFISLPLARDGYIVRGYDLDPRCVELANERAQKWGLRAEYREGSVWSVTESYDAALAFEIIEHLVDPGAFLDELAHHVRRIILTTPHLSWERGRYADWGKEELKGHIRIFDLSDVEMLLAPRGRIVDLYREPFGPTGWIFASMIVGETTDDSVTFVAPGTLEEWSPRKLDREGLGGSEIALISLAKELAAQRTSVSVYGRIDSPGYYDGVRYRRVETLVPDVRQDSVVAWRYPEAADLGFNTDNLVLWMHDVDAGDRLTPERAAKFSKIVVLTQWHASYMLKRYPWLEEMADKLVVIGNGVDPARFEGGVVPLRNPYKVAYTSSPDRGLDVLLEHIWPGVVERAPEAELHVYYGWNNWEAMEQHYPQMREFRRRIADLALATKNVVFHGRVPQDVLAKELRESNIWLYPTYFSETFCISAVEAQLAGAIPVTNDLAALSETVRAGVVIPLNGQPVQKTADAYVDVVVGLMQDQEMADTWRETVFEAAPRQSWEDVAEQWIRLVLASSAIALTGFPPFSLNTASGTVHSASWSNGQPLLSETSGTAAPDSEA